ncbi:amino acid decarboxylase, partial [Paenibacillus favisporus]|nr:amino acid decarboxylase [Paenibacillus favisporus]
AVDALVRGLAELPRFKLLHPQGQQPQDAAGAASAGSTAQAAIRPAAAAYTTQDPFKVVIYDDTGVLSGYELQERLEAYGCVPEMSDDRYVVLVYSLGSTEEDTRHLLDALRHITVEKADAQNSADALPAAESRYSVQAEAEEDLSLTGASSLPKTQGSPAEFSTWNILAQATVSEPIPFGLQPIPAEDTERVPLQDCADRTAAEMIIPYPPGIPLLYPGERITEDTAARLRVLSNAGAKCQGAADPNLLTIMVYKKNRKQGSHL